MSTTSTNKSDMKRVRFPHEMLAEIDTIIGDGGNFSAWVKEACREKLDKHVNCDNYNIGNTHHGRK